MQQYLVFTGEYPFDLVIGNVHRETPEAALQTAINKFKDVDPHPVVEPVPSIYQ